MLNSSFKKKTIRMKLLSYLLTNGPHINPLNLSPFLLASRYAFLNGDTETPVIISDKLSDEEMTKLITILEKHTAVFDYSLQDLKGISPTLCTHCIPIDPSKTPSREPQRRLNNAMREVVKKEVLKLLHAGLIYPCHIASGLGLFKLCLRKEAWSSLITTKMSLSLNKPSRDVGCVYYHKLNAATKKDHFPLPFIDETKS
jgi:hypothetical protein